MKKLLQLFFLACMLCAILPSHFFAQEFDNGEIGITLNSWGRVRVYSPSILEGNQQIDRFSMLVGGNEFEVFDYSKDAETVDSLRTVENPEISDTELYVSVDNTYPSTLEPPEEIMPPAIELKVNVYGWNSGGYCLVKYTITNNEAETINLKPGFEILPQVDGAYGFENVSYSNKKITIEKGGLSTNTVIMAMSEDISSLQAFNWYEGYNVSDTTLHEWLNTEGIISSFNSDDNGAVSIGSFAGGEFASGAEKEIWFAIAAGDRFNIDGNVNKAIQKYNELITGVDENITGIPGKFELNQNYPNPFNPSTTIGFSIPELSNVTLDVFNSLGEKVDRQILGELQAGYYSVKYNAGNLSSGIYYYRLSAGEFVTTKKMMLVK
jgi:hypothetical protein